MSTLISNDNTKDLNLIIIRFNRTHVLLNASVNIGNTGNTWWNYGKKRGCALAISVINIPAHRMFT